MGHKTEGCLIEAEILSGIASMEDEGGEVLSVPFVCGFYGVRNYYDASGRRLGLTVAYVAVQGEMFESIRDDDRVFVLWADPMATQANRRSPVGSEDGRKLREYIDKITGKPGTGLDVVGSDVSGLSRAALAHRIKFWIKGLIA